MDRYRWAERHDGLLTEKIVRSSGRGRKQRQRDRDLGRVRVVRRGVVAVNGSPRSWRQEVRAVLLSCGDLIAASHGTAQRLLDGVEIRMLRDEDAFHVIAPLTRKASRDGVIAHRSGTIEKGDIVTRGDMRTTSPLRTVIDLSGTLCDKDLGLVVDDFVRRKQMTLDDLRERTNRTLPAPGRSVGRLRRVLGARLPGYDPGESELEGRIARLIGRAGLPQPTQQHRVQLGRDRYRIDFAWPEHKVYLEGNGFGFHSLSSDLDRDARRQNRLVLDGWRPIEITWRMSDVEIEKTIRAFLIP
jgi:hypothetical protein